jgi:hypothetical protein
VSAYAANVGRPVIPHVQREVTSADAACQVGRGAFATTGAWRRDSILPTLQTGVQTAMVGGLRPLELDSASAPNLRSPLAARVVLPRLLLDAGLADMATLGLATSIAAEADVAVVHALCRWRLVAPRALCAAFAAALELRVVELDDPALAPVEPPPLPRALCVRLRVLPVWRRGQVLGLGMSDPTDDEAVDQVVRSCGVSVERLLVNDDALERALRRRFPVEPRPISSSGTVTSTPTPTPTPKSPHASQAPMLTTVMPTVSSPVSSSSMSAKTVVAGASVSIEAPGGPSVFGPGPVSQDPSLDSHVPVTTTPLPSERAPSMRVAVSKPTPPPGAGPAPPARHDEAARPGRGPAAPVPNEHPPADTTASPPLQMMPASDDRTIPDDSLMFLMRVLVVAEKDVATVITPLLRPRIKQLLVVPLAQALVALEQRRYDEVIVVAPPDTVSGSQQLATLATRAKKGVVIFTTIGDFARLPGVRQALPLPSSTHEVCHQVAELLRKRAHGE